MSISNDYILDSNKLDQILESVKQDKANYKPRSNEPVGNVTPSKPLWGHWQDWISFAVLVVVLADYLRKQVRWLRYDYWFGQRKARHGDDMVSIDLELDEVSPLTKSPLRNRRRGKRGRKENQLRQRGQESDDDKVLKQAQNILKRQGPPSGINTYDIAKLIAVFTMIIDHYGYFGIPGISYTTARWTRIIGRVSAPLFFFLTGYSGKFRFRWRTWCYAVFLFAANAWLGLRLTATSFESLVIILFLNWGFQYIKFEKLNHWILHIPIFVALFFAKDYCSNTLRIAYGSLPFTLAIAGYLTKRKHYMSKPWAIASMTQFAYVAVGVFAQTEAQTRWICGLVAVEGVMFMFFNRFARTAEFKIFNNLGPIKDFLLYVSRNALLVYVGHLMLFRLIQMKTWNW
jgi:hypothetical protein